MPPHFPLPSLPTLTSLTSEPDTSLLHNLISLFFTSLSALFFSLLHTLYYTLIITLYLLPILLLIDICCLSCCICTIPWQWFSETSNLNSTSVGGSNAATNPETRSRRPVNPGSNRSENDPLLAPPPARSSHLPPARSAGGISPNLVPRSFGVAPSRSVSPFLAAGTFGPSTSFDVSSSSSSSWTHGPLVDRQPEFPTFPATMPGGNVGGGNGYTKIASMEYTTSQIGVKTEVRGSRAHVRRTEVTHGGAPGPAGRVEEIEEGGEGGGEVALRR